MADKKEHGSIYCGPRGWYSKANDEYILNELPALPGEPKSDSKKDPEVYNLMPVCRTIRCDIPPPPLGCHFYCFYSKDYFFQILTLSKIGYFPKFDFFTSWHPNHSQMPSFGDVTIRRRWTTCPFSPSANCAACPATRTLAPPWLHVAAVAK